MTNKPKSNQKRKQHYDPLQLPKIAIISTTNCDCDDFEGAMTELLERSKKPFEIIFLDAIEENLIQTLELAQISAIVIIDKLRDQEESCGLMTMIGVSPKLSNLILDSLTIVEPPKEEKTTVSDIADFDHILLRLVTKTN